MPERSFEADSVLRHVVLFAFKPEIADAQIHQVEEAFRRLPAQIDAIQDFEWGTDVSVEEMAHGYTHCFFLTFLSAEDRDAYLPHPAHREFGSALHPLVESVLVLDYWSQK